MLQERRVSADGLPGNGLHWRRSGDLGQGQWPVFLRVVGRDLPGEGASASESPREY